MFVKKGAIIPSALESAINLKFVNATKDFNNHSNFNAKEYFVRTMESCINQSMRDIEIIIVDDHGNDGTMDIAREYAKRDSRIKIITNSKNLHVLKSRIAGILHAKAPFIMNVDADDYIDLLTCEKLYFATTQNGGGGGRDDEGHGIDAIETIFYAGRLVEQRGGNKVRENIFLHENFSREEFFKIYNAKYKFVHGIAVTCVLIPRTLALQAYAFFSSNHDVNIAEDVVTSFVMWHITKRICYIEDNLYHYTYNAGSMSKEKGIIKLPEKIAGFKDCYEYTKDLVDNKIKPDFSFEFMRGLTEDFQTPKIHSVKLDFSTPDSKKLTKKFMFFSGSTQKYLQKYLWYLNKPTKLRYLWYVSVGRVILRRLFLKRIILRLFGIRRD